MFLSKFFKISTIGCLAAACVVGSMTAFSSSASADDYLSEVYDTKNYDHPYATDRVIVAFKKEGTSLFDKNAGRLVSVSY